jgi:hypothetical protein
MHVGAYPVLHVNHSIIIIHSQHTEPHSRYRVHVQILYNLQDICEVQKNNVTRTGDLRVVRFELVMIWV